MKIKKSALRKLIAENLGKSKEFKTLNEKFYPKGIRKLGKDDDNRGGKVSHEAEGEIEPTMMSELDPEVYPFADPGHEDYREMKKRFEDDPSLFSDYRKDARIKTMFYGKKGEPKTHRPKITAADLEGIEGLRFPEDMTDTQANREIGTQSRDEFAPYAEGGESFNTSASSRRGPSKARRQSDAIMKIDNMQVGIQEKILEFQEAGEQDRVDYLTSLYNDLDEVKEVLASIRI